MRQDVWLFYELWMDWVQKFKVRSVILRKEHYFTLKEYFKMLIYKVTSYCEVSPSAGARINQVQNRQVPLGLSWLTSTMGPRYASAPTWTFLWNLLGSLKTPASLSTAWSGSLLGTLPTFSLIWRFSWQPVV